MVIKYLINYLVSSDSAIIGALSSGVAIGWPPEWPTLLRQQGVLLLDAEPRLQVADGLHRLGRGLPEVGLGWLLLVGVGVAEDDLVVAGPERVPEHGDRVQVDVGDVPVGESGTGIPAHLPNWKI